MDTMWQSQNDWIPLSIPFIVGANVYSMSMCMVLKKSGCDPLWKDIEMYCQNFFKEWFTVASTYIIAEDKPFWHWKENMPHFLFNILNKINILCFLSFIVTWLCLPMFTVVCLIQTSIVSTMKRIKSM